jgi:nitroreductase
MELNEALRTTGAARSFTDEPVDDATVAAILDTARFAPSGGNRQGWRVAVVQDPHIRREIARLTQPVWNQYVAMASRNRAAFNAIDNVEPPVDAPEVPNELTEKIASIPVVLAVAVNLAKVSMLDKDLTRPAIVGGASIYPFCWSILLAARSFGLSGVITTFLSRVEPDAAPLLGLPPEHALAATIMLGHPVKQITKLSRLPVGTFATVDRFDGAVFGEEAFG